MKQGRDVHRRPADPYAIRGESDGIDLLQVPLTAPQFLAGGYIPKPDYARSRVSPASRIVPTPCRQYLAIGGEGHVAALVPSKATHQLSRSHIPEMSLCTECLCRGQELTVRRESNRFDPQVFVLAESPDQFSGPRVPKLDLITAGGKKAAVRGESEVNDVAVIVRGLLAFAQDLPRGRVVERDRMPPGIRGENLAIGG
jgi:hypothetical protein